MPDDLKQTTIDTYNKSALALADYFRGIGARTDSIDLAFDLAGNPAHTRVVEIGCGDGRDAKEIVARSEWYEGMDISDGLLALARQHVPGAHFIQGDAATYKFPNNLDIIFSFASLLHSTKEEVRGVLLRAHKALRPGGIFYLSLKYAPQYKQDIKKDQYGTRLFYFYNAEIIAELAKDNYVMVKEWRHTQGNTEWVEIVLRNT